MKRAIKKLLLATSIAVGMGGMFTAPALAGSLINSSIGGSAADDYYLYKLDGTNTSFDNNANLQDVLSGDKVNPGGNVELAASSEEGEFDFTKNTTLEGQIGGKDIIFSSLTEDDWNTQNYKGSGKSFGEFWFEEALEANEFEYLLETPSFAITNPFGVDDLFSAFKSKVGLKRFSDPNISYVNQDITGKISIGLAGHYDAKGIPLLESLLAVAEGFRESDDSSENETPKPKPIPIQVSEVVKVTYNGKTEFLYSFNADKTGLTDIDDGFSHNGNYEVQIQGEKPENLKHSRTAKVPEPSVMLGLLGVAGVFVSKRKVKKA